MAFSPQSRTCAEGLIKGAFCALGGVLLVYIQVMKPFQERN